MREIYFATVAIEKNRWAPGRIASLTASDYIARAKADGFDGTELWENHFLMASKEEKDRIIRSGEVKIFNSYVSLADENADYTPTIEAINAIRPRAVKYNFGREGDVEAQKKRLLTLADQLAEDVKLLCECHAGTLMEDPVVAGQVFHELDERFGAIIHLSAEQDLMESCFAHYGNRIHHIHAQNRVGGAYAFYAEHADRLSANWNYMRQNGFDGTVSVEFTVDGQTPDETYANACKDLAWLRTLG